MDVFFFAQPDADEDYLGFGGEFVQTEDAFKVVQIDAEFADWQQGRMASGLAIAGWERFDSLDAALTSKEAAFYRDRFKARGY